MTFEYLKTHPQPCSCPFCAAEQLSGSKPVLSGRWRHSHGMIFCGTLRIAKGDFDTNPHPDFCARVFDDICRTMNAAQALTDKPPTETTKTP